MSKSQAVSVPVSLEPAARDSGRVAVHSPALEPPTVLGRYALFGRIGAGGMGVVHLGRLLGSAGFERAVAIKRVHPLLANDPHFTAMFRDELRLLARVRHQHVISALDVVEVDGELLLVMEYAHGESLAALLQRSARAATPIPVEIALTIACGVLKGLHAAHTATSAAGELLGIIHRDVSPHNVLVGCDGFARIVDFGVAKWAHSHQVTRVGELRGKPGYVAPEQVLGELATPRSDIYALSVVLWEMLAVQRLFAGKSVAETIERVSSGEIPRLAAVSQRKVSPAVEAVVRRGLSRDAAARFATAREMAAALEKASRLVSPDELGDWVSRTAGPPLAERARQLSWTENCVIGDEASLNDDSEQTLVRTFEVREEPTTRDFPLEPLLPSIATPRAAAPPAPVPHRSGKKRALIAAVIVFGALVSARLYRNAAASAEEATRARAAAAVARAGLVPALAAEPAPASPAQAAPSAAPPAAILPVAAPIAASSAAPARAHGARAVAPAGGKLPVTANVPKAKAVDVDGF